MAAHFGGFCKRWVGLVLAVVAVMMFAPLVARATPPTYTVNVTTDSGGVTGAGSGLSGDLRYCIMQADNGSPGSTVQFDSSLDGQTITLGSTLTIGTSMTITGPGANLLTISGGNAVGVFNINSGATVSISGLTIANGNTVFGGGINNRGMLEVSNSIFSGNSASNGGGIFSFGTLMVTNSTFSGNTAPFGGGIWSAGLMAVVSNSTFSGNVAPNGGGGGIWVNAPVAMTVSNSTFSANRADGGGGMYNYLATLAVSNSVFSGNVGAAPDSGAGIYNEICSGIYCPPAGSATASYNVFYNNLDVGTTEDDCNGCNTNSPAIDTTSPVLATLGNYGGPTPTMLPLPGSAAICAGSMPLIPAGVTTDQRGFPRLNTTYPGYTSPNPPCLDLGAVETNYQSIQFTNAVSGYSALVNQDAIPDPLVSVTENGQNIGGVPLTLGFNGTGTPSGLGPVITAAGSGALFSSLTVDTPGSDTLSATLQITPTISITTSPTASLVITQASTTTTITGHTPNPSGVGEGVAVSFTVTPVVSTTSTPTGTVTVSDGAGDTCQAPVATGHCTLTITTVGTKTLTASYPGDSNFQNSTSPGVTQGVGDFTISASPAVQTIPSGHSAAYTLTLDSLDGLTGSVSLACSGGPPHSTCTVTPSSVALNGTAKVKVTLSAPKNGDHGTFTLTFTGKYGTGTPSTGGLTHSTHASLTVK